MGSYGGCADFRGNFQPYRMVQLRWRRQTLALWTLRSGWSDYCLHHSLLWKVRMSLSLYLLFFHLFVLNYCSPPLLLDVVAPSLPLVVLELVLSTRQGYNYRC